jgi:predicted dehydrogenase
LRTRIAVAGAGYIGLAHIDALRASPTSSLAAIVDPSPAAKKAAAEADVPLFASIDELIGKARPDGIVLATPNQLHVAQALQCIEAGLVTFVEKPIAPTVAEGEELVRAVERKRARLLVGHHRAHSPIMAKAKEVVDSGVLGRLVGVMGSATFFKPEHYFDEGPWRKQPGGGPILINMIHEVHNLRMLCGEIVAVQAIASRAVRRVRRGAGDCLARGARLPGRRHRGDQHPVRERRARQLHALRHGRLCAELGADLAGKQGLSEL